MREILEPFRRRTRGTRIERQQGETLDDMAEVRDRSARGEPLKEVRHLPGEQPGADLGFQRLAVVRPTEPGGPYSAGREKYSRYGRTLGCIGPGRAYTPSGYFHLIRSRYGRLRCAANRSGLQPPFSSAEFGVRRCNAAFFCFFVSDFGDMAAKQRNKRKRRYIAALQRIALNTNLYS